ncbi:MAG: hypothetical protein QS721_03785 [Candidatus Endonucleobacter sp. (ex Gigantidas childressi)]|nr:hypothetical protein [Candidatus Endonucleobacter sp. (ex Gigantidas childressi)]
MNQFGLSRYNLLLTVARRLIAPFLFVFDAFVKKSPQSNYRYIPISIEGMDNLQTSEPMILPVVGDLGM